jgi:hypothetical protein
VKYLSLLILFLLNLNLSAGPGRSPGIIVDDGEFIEVVILNKSLEAPHFLGALKVGEKVSSKATVFNRGSERLFLKKIENQSQNFLTKVDQSCLQEIAKNSQCEFEMDFQIKSFGQATQKLRFHFITKSGLERSIEWETTALGHY